jgi:hypothetical protein
MSATALFKIDSYSPDELVVNPELLLSEPAILLAGQNLKRGALLGKITASGKSVLSLAAATDGSEVPYSILVDDTDATDGDKATITYTRGDFVADSVIYGAGHTRASVAAGLKAMAIYLITALGGA